VPFTDVQAPEYMSEKQKEEFMRIADMLLALNVFTELDVDCLARYVLEHELYLAQHNEVRRARKSGNTAKLKEAEIMYDKTVRRIRGLASDLGLTPTSRMKLSVPPPPADDDEL
jgi:P27 family predicted phage terminase small subunit